MKKMETTKLVVFFKYNITQLNYDLGRMEVLLMLINLIFKFSENFTFTEFDYSKNFSLYKSLETDHIPRKNDYVYDSGEKNF